MDLEAAKAAHAKAVADRDALRQSIDQARRQVDDARDRFLATSPQDAKALEKADGERARARRMLEVLEHSLEEAEGAAQEATAALAKAQRAHDAAESATRFEKLGADRARLEKGVAEKVQAFRAAIRADVAALHEVVRAGWAPARELGEEWQGHHWPEPDASDLLARLEVVTAPPRAPDPVQMAHEAMVRAADRRADARFLAGLGLVPAPAPAPRPPPVQESGLTEGNLARMRGP